MTTTIHPIRAATRAHPVLRSVGAVAGALFTVAIITGIADQILHWIGVFPPWGQITYEPGPYLLAIAYRTAFGVGGGYIAARLAPRAPLGHAVALGVVVVVLSLVGVIVTIVRGDLGPLWYPIALLVFALPSAWVCGSLFAVQGRS